MKKLLSILLALTITLSLSVTFSAKSTDETDSAYAENNSQTFTDIEAVRKKIKEIYNPDDQNKNDFEYFQSLAASLRDSINNDIYFTYKENCGPCSTAFQKILYDNGITVENQISNLSRDHVFNLLRTSYTSSPNVETDIVIDTTYKQFITGAYTSAGYTFDDMAKELPNVLIYEYGNYEQLCEQLSGLTKRFDQTKAASLCKNVYDSHYCFEYLPNDLQYLNSYNDAIEFSSQFIEDLRTTTAKFSVKLDNTPVLNSTTSDLQKEFVYDANGVYRCYLEQSEITEFAKGFTINDQNNEPIYGASTSGEVLGAVVKSYMTTANYLRKLDKYSIEPMTINTNQLYGNAVLSIDLGSGIDTPTVYIIPISRTFYYGDVNTDGNVDIYDVTYLQQCIAGDEGKQLSNMQKSIADLTKTEALNINNATAISLKIAENQDFNHGEKLYFSHSLYIGFSDGSYSDNGYIDF